MVRLGNFLKPFFDSRDSLRFAQRNASLRAARFVHTRLQARKTRSERFVVATSRLISVLLLLLSPPA